MTMKEKMLEAVKELPADATIEDAMERFLFLAKIERGIQRADAGQTISHGEVRTSTHAWKYSGEKSWKQAYN